MVATGSDNKYGFKTDKDNGGKCGGFAYSDAAAEPQDAPTPIDKKHYGLGLTPDHWNDPKKLLGLFNVEPAPTDANATRDPDIEYIEPAEMEARALVIKQQIMAQFRRNTYDDKLSKYTKFHDLQEFQKVGVKVLFGFEEAECVYKTGFGVSLNPANGSCVCWTEAETRQFWSGLAVFSGRIQSSKNMSTTNFHIYMVSETKIVVLAFNVLKICSLIAAETW